MGRITLIRSIGWFIIGCLLAVLIILLNGCGSQTDREYQCAVEGRNCEKVDRQHYTEEAGPAGARGVPGNQGPRGPGCSVKAVTKGVLVACEDGTSAALMNALSTEQVEELFTAFEELLSTIQQEIDELNDTRERLDELEMELERLDTEIDILSDTPESQLFTEIIDPCGPENPLGLEEVLLRTADGKLLGLYYIKKKYSFLSLIGPGTYITTDTTRCRFTVTPELEVLWD